MNKNLPYRPPVGGYGVKTKRITLRVPDYLHAWIKKVGPDFIRGLLEKAYKKDRKKAATL